MIDRAPVITVFGSSRLAPTEPAYAEAQRCGRLLAEAGFSVATGGYGGTMEAVSRGAASAGAHVIGVTAPAVFASRSGANAYVAEEIPAPDLVARIGIMLDLADAAIALAGSIGTLTELMVAWNVAFVARFSDAKPKPIVAVGAQWRRLLPELSDILATDGGLVTAVDDVAEAVQVIGGARDA